MSMFDGPLMFHSKPKTFATGVKINAADDYKVNDHPAWNAAQTESG